MNQRYAPGGDARAIAETARRAFGGYLEMFNITDGPSAAPT